MSLKRSTLRAMGIDDEKIEEIIAAHSETVNSLKDEIAKYKADAEKLPELQKRLDALENNHLQDDYDALKKEYEDFKNDVKNKETRVAKETAYRDMLKEIGISDKVIPSIIKVTDFNEVELDRENNIKNKPDVAEKIKRDYDGFIVSQNVKTETPETPPKNVADNGNAREHRAARLAAEYHQRLYGGIVQTENTNNNQKTEN